MKYPKDEPLMAIEEDLEIKFGEISKLTSFIINYHLYYKYPKITDIGVLEKRIQQDIKAKKSRDQCTDDDNLIISRIKKKYPKEIKLKEIKNDLLIKCDMYEGLLDIMDDIGDIKIGDIMKNKEKIILQFTGDRFGYVKAKDTY